jgi:hypothetical protein
VTQQPEAPQPATAPSGPVVPARGNAHPGYLPPVDPVPAPPLPDAAPSPAAPAPAVAEAGLGPVGVPSLPPAVPPPPPDGRWRPDRIDPVPGTEFGLVRLQVPAVASGLATGSLIAGSGSIGVSFLVLCFGVAGSSAGWGGWVAGAFALLGVLVGGGAAGLGVAALRQIRRARRPGWMRFTGRGLAIAGISCGAAGAGISLVSLALGLVLQLS